MCSQRRDCLVKCGELHRFSRQPVVMGVCGRIMGAFNARNRSGCRLRIHLRLTTARGFFACTLSRAVPRLGKRIGESHLFRGSWNQLPLRLSELAEDLEVMTAMARKAEGSNI